MAEGASAKAQRERCAKLSVKVQTGGQIIQSWSFLQLKAPTKRGNHTDEERLGRENRDQGRSQCFTLLSKWQQRRKAVGRDSWALTLRVNRTMSRLT
ncbi:hypothetical protein E5288_WYG005734 [Bos mutus]|uniref:Uncharacterized protein n=1 Tax=Bos mutus TaxID=72004 RepID=A0A6B0RZR9_9CETA|nr:hypothetical protein [Bos mutus]